MAFHNINTFVLVEIWISLIMDASAQLFSMNWTCNHYHVYTTGVCYGLDSNISSPAYIKLACSSTDEVTIKRYTDSDDACDSSPDQTFTYPINDNTTIIKCDQQQACEYATLREYANDDCQGDVYYDNPIVMGQCYAGNGSSFYYTSCANGTLEVNGYNSDYCTGAVASTYAVDYSSDSDSDDEQCTEVSLFAIKLIHV